MGYATKYISTETYRIPPLELRYWLNREVEQIELSGKGVLLHNIPTEMPVQNQETIEVRAAKKLSFRARPNHH